MSLKCSDNCLTAASTDWTGHAYKLKLSRLSPKEFYCELLAVRIKEPTSGYLFPFLSLKADKPWPPSGLDE